MFCTQSLSKIFTKLLQKNLTLRYGKNRAAKNEVIFSVLY